MDEIINKVTQSSLEIFDLEDFYPKDPIVTLDISQWLEEGFLLKEKEYRNAVKNYDFSLFENKIVGLHCSTNAILPSWAYLVVATHLLGTAKKVFQASKKEIILTHYHELLATIDYNVYNDKSVIIKGCSKKEVPQEIYTLTLNYLQKHAKSIMYGEACSAVPVFKRK